MKIIPHKKFLMAMERFELVNEKEEILVAFSGGPDSTSCLLNLKAVEKERGIKISAIYIDHGLRENLEEEKEFVRELCKKFNIPLYFEKIKISRRKNIEEEAREKRRKIFERYIKNHGFNKIATGHTLNDVMETLLFRSFRGGFGDKIIGIIPKEGFYIRPVILMTKRENIKFLNKLRMNYRIDITNFNTEITRNYIRHKIIPHFYEIFPEWEKGFLKTYISFVHQREFIKSHIEKILRNYLFMKGEFFYILKNPPFLLDYEIKELVTFLFQKIMKEKSLSFFQKEEIKKIYKKGKGRVSLSENIFFEMSTGYMSVFKQVEFKRKYIVKKGIFKWKPLDIKIKVNEEIEGILRTWEEGDYIYINKKRKKMKKFYNELKIPRFLRKYLPLIAKGKKVLWIYPDIFSDDLKKLANYDKIIEVKNETQGSDKGKRN